MKERPILFSTEMVKAILEGRKTQTRRVIKPQPQYAVMDKNSAELFEKFGGDGSQFGLTYKGARLGPDFWSFMITHYCPYGQIGDILWVRETWCELYDYETHEEWPGCPDEVWSLGYRYKADGYEHRQQDGFWKGWKPSIHMPKEACRLFLKITDIRIERLQDISEEDAKTEGAEGVLCQYVGDAWNQGYTSYFEGFKKLWQSINGPESWEANPWVWIIEFERIKKP